MTAAHVLADFRSALLALVPIAERAGIGWRRDVAYDEWDSVASSLFKAFVEEPIRWALPEAERSRFSLPPYDLLLERYETTAVIEVLVPGTPGRRIFHALGTRLVPFGICECRAVDCEGVPLSNEIEAYPLEVVHLRVVHRTEDGRVLVLGGPTDANASEP